MSSNSSVGPIILYLSCIYQANLYLKKSMVMIICETSFVDWVINYFWFRKSRKPMWIEVLAEFWNCRTLMQYCNEALMLRSIRNCCFERQQICLQAIDPAIAMYISTELYCIYICSHIYICVHVRTHVAALLLNKIHSARSPETMLKFLQLLNEYINKNLHQNYPTNTWQCHTCGHPLQWISANQLWQHDQSTGGQELTS